MLEFKKKVDFDIDNFVYFYCKQLVLLLRRNRIKPLKNPYW